MPKPTKSEVCPSCSISCAYPAEFQALTHLKPSTAKFHLLKRSNQSDLWHHQASETRGETSCDENQLAGSLNQHNRERRQDQVVGKVIMQDCIPASQQSQRRGQHRKPSIFPGTSLWKSFWFLEHQLHRHCYHGPLLGPPLSSFQSPVDNPKPPRSSAHAT